MKEIRRDDRSATTEEAMILLENSEYGVLSTVSEKNQPYGIPLNFCMIDKELYIHCALEGQKVDNIASNSAVSFCVVGKTEVLPDKFGTKYESAVVAGTMEEVFDTQKLKALEGLLYKYSADFIPEGMAFIEKLKDKTKVYKISINTITAKARRH